jgi:predicted TIM-barrel fold metal-dependent hydrolase
MPAYPLITLEEHFIAPDDLAPKALLDRFGPQFAILPKLHTKLRSLGDLTLRQDDMNLGGITVQIVSHAPGLTTFSSGEIKPINDFLAANIAGKSWLRGFASLPMGEPETAAEELKRCVKEFGFVGALIDNHVVSTGTIAGGPPANEPEYFDALRFRPVFKAAVELDVPIYLHPTFPTGSQKERRTGAYSAGAAGSLGTSGWGWHAECGEHVLRLFAAGIFDELPTLKIVIGHFGEMLPGMFGRVARYSTRWGERERKWKDVWQENIWVTTSGVWGMEPMGTIKQIVPDSKVMYSVDWPFAEAIEGKEWWDEFEKSGIYPDEVVESIAWKNAAAIFNISDDAIGKAVIDIVKPL